MFNRLNYKIALALLPLLPLLAQGSSSLRPEWTKKSYYNMNTNESFLGAIKVNATPKSDLDLSLDKKLANETQLKYEGIVRNYEMRRTYGLTDSQEELDFASQMGGMAKDLARQVQNTQIKRKMKSARTAAMRDENISKAAKPIAIATAITAACTGTPVTLRFGNSTEVHSITNVIEQTGQIQFVSPEIKGGIDVAVKTPERAREVAIPGEKYRFSLLRDIPLVDVTSGIAYGTTSTGFTASLSKQVYDNVTCVVDSTRPLYESALPAHQETVRLLYGITF
ncbi:MAG: hypothetical protein A2X97_13030 [Bdellovibrionales bacterium GWA1_52_35]|nr:MAG: hypothetical protein A2X97_13030 [Bdellovibrionales bacterium GWA1_52_35]HCM39949.1 hypothetical protein [Bdellovibrionales bacterium]